MFPDRRSEAKLGGNVELLRDFVSNRGASNLVLQRKHTWGLKRASCKGINPIRTDLSPVKTSLDSRPAVCILCFGFFLVQLEIHLVTSREMSFPLSGLEVKIRSNFCLDTSNN